MQRLIPFAILALAPFVLLRGEDQPPAPLAPDHPLPALIPAECLLYVEAGELIPLLEQGLEHPFVTAVRESDLGLALLSKLPYTPESALERANAWLRRPVLPVLATLARGGVALGYDPVEKKAVLVARGRDADEVEQALAAVLDAIESQLGMQGALARPHERRNGADIWRLGEARLARRGDLVVLSNDAHLVTEVLELASDPDADGLLENPGFRQLHSERPRGAALWAWFDMAGIEPHADEGFARLRTSHANPGVHGLLGAEVGALLSAPLLAAALVPKSVHELELHLAASGAPCRAELAPGSRPALVPADGAAEGFASALLYRDYARFLNDRVDLFPPEALPGFAEALTNGALFFEGRDLGEDVLPHVSPWIRLLVREPAFGDGREPEIPLPAAALVLALDDEASGDQWVSAFQTVLAITNIDQAQKGGKSLRMRLGIEGDVQITSARYPTPGPAEGVDMRYNLEPSMAVVGRHLVLGTHIDVVRELVRGLAGKDPQESSVHGESLMIEAEGLRRLLARNFEVLVASKMVEDGLERADAEDEIGGLRLVVETLESIGVELGCERPGSPRLKLDLRLNLARSTR